MEPLLGMKAVDDTPRGKLYIDGYWVETGDHRAVVDPATGADFAAVSVAGKEGCQAAIAAADNSAAQWAQASPRSRAELLRRAFEIMVEHREQLARLITLENGKALADAQAEVVYAAEFFRWFSEEAVRIAGDFRTAPAGDKRIVVTHRPVGVSMLVTPWNFPAAMVTRKLAPALAAGCSVVLKPASETPLTALAIAEVLERAGAPSGVVNVVVATPTPIRVREMLHDGRVRNLSFTGSTEVGVSLLHEAADQVLRTSMELGGNAPFLVLEDADLDAAVAGAMVAKLRNGGAACTAANRIYVHASISKEFSSRLGHAMRALRVGPGIDPSNDVGALVSISERDKVGKIVEEALADGARAAVGGTTAAGVGAFYPPTLLVGVAPDANILDVEIFGPVAPVVTFETDADAIRMANSTRYGLIGYVYSGNARRALAIAEQLEVGMVAINRGALSDPAAPFGGMKESGIGREGGFVGIHEFLETKYIASDI
jgi:succinate-semialdehyde dehydrogenase/glutarate-semialdehyde dehydrogenase